jgi:tRNA pseudouridine55 synthase
LATGLLVVGVGRGTRLLTYLSGLDKSYQATIRLGWSTLTDDAEGSAITFAAPELMAGLSEPAVTAAVSQLTGPLQQVPSTYSAIKIGGVRAYAAARAGQTPQLAARPVVVHSFAVLDSCRHQVDQHTVLDLEVTVTVSSGTYVRALARDLGAALGVGGHLTKLRRSSVGPFNLSEASQLDALANRWQMLGLAQAARRVLPTCRLTANQVTAWQYGQKIAVDIAAAFGEPLGDKPDQPTVVAVLDPAEQLAGIGHLHKDGQLKPVAVFPAN